MPLYKGNNKGKQKAVKPTANELKFALMQANAPKVEFTSFSKFVHKGRGVYISEATDPEDRIDRDIESEEVNASEISLTKHDKRKAIEIDLTDDEAAPPKRKLTKADRLRAQIVELHRQIQVAEAELEKSKKRNADQAGLSDTGHSNSQAGTTNNGSEVIDLRNGHEDDYNSDSTFSSDASCRSFDREGYPINYAEKMWAKHKENQERREKYGLKPRSSRKIRRESSPDILKRIRRNRRIIMPAPEVIEIRDRFAKSGTGNAPQKQTKSKENDNAAVGVTNSTEEESEEELDPNLDRWKRKKRDKNVVINLSNRGSTARRWQTYFTLAEEAFILYCKSLDPDWLSWDQIAEDMIEFSGRRNPKDKSDKTSYRVKRTGHACHVRYTESLTKGIFADKRLGEYGYTLGFHKKWDPIYWMNNDVWARWYRGLPLKAEEVKEVELKVEMGEPDAEIGEEYDPQWEDNA